MGEGGGVKREDKKGRGRRKDGSTGGRFGTGGGSQWKG